MSNKRAVDLYRMMLRLYPGRFRDEYGSDMALLFAEQLRDEPSTRVWARGLVDLAISVPTRHLEARMERPTSNVVPMLFTVLSVTAICLAIIGGSSPGMLAVGLSIALMAAGVAVTAWRHVRPVVQVRPATDHWWKFLVGGIAILATVIVFTTATGEVDGSMWWPMMITLVCALMGLGLGLVLLAQRMLSRHRSTPG